MDSELLLKTEPRVALDQIANGTAIVKESDAPGLIRVLAKSLLLALDRLDALERAQA